MSTELNDQEMYDALIEEAPYSPHDGLLYGYHSSSPAWATSPNTTYRFGIEAEKEDDNGIMICQAYQGDRQQFLPHSWRAERDGSLGHDGFELISPVYNLNDDKYKEDLGNPVLNYLIHRNTSYRCGGHMTVSVRDKDQEWYTKKAAQIIPLLYALYPKRAKKRGYARFFNKDDYRDRYNAINLGSNDRMEIRIFSAIKHMKQLEWRVELLKLLFVSDRYDDLKWESIYQDLLNTNSPLGKHIFSLYPKNYGEKVMLATAYHKAFEKQYMEWKTYTRIRKLVPISVRSSMMVHPQPNKKNNNGTQLVLDVCDYSQERTTEA